MKILIKNAVFFILMAIILFLTVTCVEPGESNDKIIDTGITFGSFNLGAKLDVKDEQVWMPNYNTGKISQMLLKFTGSRDVKVVVIEYINVPPYRNFLEVGEGKIKEGILTFNVEEDNMKGTNLLDGGDLLEYYFNEWTGDGEIAINPSTVKGNIITLVSLYDSAVPVEAVIREGFSGTNNSLTGEYIYYIYVNADCEISAKEVKKTELKYTYNKLDLSLKSGWNTILKSETYTTTGDSSYSMTIKNPAINWVMQKIKN